MWLQRNRSQRRSNLTDEQVDKLNALGMDWESVQSKNERHWLSMLELLKTYKKEFKDIYVKKEQIYKGVNLGSNRKTHTCLDVPYETLLGVK